MGVGGQRHAPAAVSPGKTPRAHCTGDWVRPKDGLGGSRKSRPPPGFNSRTLEPVASHCIAYTIAAHHVHKY